MIFRGVPWRSATLSDANYVYYVNHRNNQFPPLLQLNRSQAHLIKSILEPDVSRRFSLDAITSHVYFQSIDINNLKCLDFGHIKTNTNN